MAIGRVNCVVIGLFIVVMIATTCAAACDRETIRDYMRQCSHFIGKRSIRPVMDNSIMGRLRSLQNSNVCQPVNPNEVAQYDEGTEVSNDIPDQVVQKVNEILDDFAKEELLQSTGVYRRRSRHAPVRRGFQCDIQILAELCGKKKK